MQAYEAQGESLESPFRCFGIFISPCSAAKRCKPRLELQASFEPSTDHVMLVFAVDVRVYVQMVNSEPEKALGKSRFSTRCHSDDCAVKVYTQRYTRAARGNRPTQGPCKGARGDHRRPEGARTNQSRAHISNRGCTYRGKSRRGRSTDRYLWFLDVEARWFL